MVKVMTNHVRFSLFFAFSFLVLMVPVLSAQAKRIEYGVKGGVPLNNIVTTSGSIQDDTYGVTAGGAIELHLPLLFSIEANAIYKRPGYWDIDGTIERKRFSQWEFPIMGKVYPLGRNPAIQPYASAGMSFRRLSTSFFGSEADAGLVTAIGVRNGPGRIKFPLELRYTRWLGETPLIQGSQGPTAWLNQNQIEFLVGLIF